MVPEILQFFKSSYKLFRNESFDFCCRIHFNFHYTSKSISTKRKFYFWIKNKITRRQIGRIERVRQTIGISLSANNSPFDSAECGNYRCHDEVIRLLSVIFLDGFLRICSRKRINTSLYNN